MNDLNVANEPADINTTAIPVKPKRTGKLIAWIAFIIAIGSIVISAISMRTTMHLQKRIETVYQSLKDNSNQIHQIEAPTPDDNLAKNWIDSPQQLALFCYQNILQAKMVLWVNQDPALAATILNHTYALLETAPESFTELKKSMLNDIKALQASKPNDTNQIYSQLENLIQQINISAMATQSPIQQIPHTTSITPAIANGYLAQIKEAGMNFARNVRSMIVVHQTPNQTSSILLPEYQTQTKLTINLLLSQAQIAVITHNQTLYTSTLQRAETLIKQIFALNPALMNNLSEKIENLLKLNLNAALPDLNNTLQQASTLLNSTQTIKKGAAT